MNEFEWLRQTRALKRDIAPDRDLWQGIADRIGSSAGTRRPAWLPWTSAAAVVLVSLLIGTLSLRAPIAPEAPYRLSAAAPQRWKPSDPRLVGAAIEFDAASSQLQLAMRQAPEAAFLHRIQQRTRAQQMRLERYPERAP